MIQRIALYRNMIVAFVSRMSGRRQMATAAWRVSTACNIHSLRQASSARFMAAIVSAIVVWRCGAGGSARRSRGSCGSGMPKARAIVKAPSHTLTELCTLWIRQVRMREERGGRQACMHACMHAGVRACLRACMHACMRARMRACTRARTHASMHACTHACTHACVHACTHARTHARMHACRHACVHACMRACMHACTHARACSHARTNAGMCACMRSLAQPSRSPARVLM